MRNHAPFHFLAVAYTVGLWYVHVLHIYLDHAANIVWNEHGSNLLQLTPRFHQVRFAFALTAPSVLSWFPCTVEPHDFELSIWKIGFKNRCSTILNHIQWWALTEWLHCACLVSSWSRCMTPFVTEAWIIYKPSAVAECRGIPNVPNWHTCPQPKDACADLEHLTPQLSVLIMVSVLEASLFVETLRTILPTFFVLSKNKFSGSFWICGCFSNSRSRVYC